MIRILSKRAVKKVAIGYTDSAKNDRRIAYASSREAAKRACVYAQTLCVGEKSPLNYGLGKSLVNIPDAVRLYLLRNGLLWNQLAHRRVARAYQQRHRESGLCVKCSRKVENNHYCSRHKRMARETARDYQRERYRRLNNIPVSKFRSRNGNRKKPIGKTS